MMTLGVGYNFTVQNSASTKRKPAMGYLIWWGVFGTSFQVPRCIPAMCCVATEDVTMLFSVCHQCNPKLAFPHLRQLVCGTFVSLKAWIHRCALEPGGWDVILMLNFCNCSQWLTGTPTTKILPLAHVRTCHILGLAEGTGWDVTRNRTNFLLFKCKLKACNAGLSDLRTLSRFVRG